MNRSLALLLIFFSASSSIADNRATIIYASSFSSASRLNLQSSTTSTAQEVATLELGKLLERELAGEQKHNYQITLVEGQYACVIVEQRGIDAIVQLLGTDGKVSAEFNAESQTQGEEKIEFVAETAGSYRLLVKSQYPKLPAGVYTIRLSEMRDATEADRWLYEARRLETTSRQLWGAGKYTEALAPGEKALELQERRWGAEHPELTSPLLNLAANSYLKGDYAKAHAQCQRAVTIAEKTLGAEHWRVGRLLFNLAVFSAAAGNFSSAESLYQRAIAIQEKAFGSDHPLVVSTLGELAVLYRRKGEFARAEPLLQRALTAQEKTLGEEDSNVASTLTNLAGVYREMGAYVKAEPLYQRALAIREKTNHPYLAVALNNLANLYRELGDYVKAEVLYERSITIKEKSVGANHPEVADTRSNLALIYLARGDYARAETLLLRVVATLEKALGSTHPKVGLQISYLANLYFTTRDYEQAESLYLRALSILETARGPNYYSLANILTNLAQISATQGKLTEALAYQMRANAIIEYNLSLNLVIGSERQKLDYLAQWSEQMNRAVMLHIRFMPDNLAAREMAATTALQRKGRIQDALSGNLASLRQRFSAADKMLLDQLNEISAQLARLALSETSGAMNDEQQKRLKVLAAQRENLESEISRRSTEYRATSQPVTLASIKSSIPDDAALIEIGIYQPFNPKVEKEYSEPRYGAYVLHHGKVEWQELGEVKTIDGVIEKWREALRDPRRQDVAHLARAVDEKIMKPLRPLLGKATHLLISPDGMLNLIPFEALVDEQNRFLVEDFSCTYLTSGRDLLRLQIARQSQSPPVVLADPLFGEPVIAQAAKAHAPKARQGLSGNKRQSITTADDLASVYFAPLSGTAAEAHAIKSLFAEALILTGTQATEATFRQVFAPRLLHIATHGFFLTDASLASANASGERTRSINAMVKTTNPLLRSGLAFAGANLHQSGNDDGILTALEASGLNLWGTKLVTLSACDTGLGEVKNGEGVYGLRRAFMLAGAETIVMSLWAVSDYVTRELMTNYYKGLKQGLGRGEALRQVQLQMLKSKGREHPFYWASFIQAGEWANLDGKR